MNSESLIVSVGVEYPSLPSNVVSVRTVGFILTLKGQVFSLVFYNCMNSPQSPTPELIGKLSQLHDQLCTHNTVTALSITNNHHDLKVTVPEHSTQSIKQYIEQFSTDLSVLYSEPASESNAQLTVGYSGRV